MSAKKRVYQKPKFSVKELKRIRLLSKTKSLLARSGMNTLAYNWPDSSSHVGSHSRAH